MKHVPPAPAPFWVVALLVLTGCTHAEADSAVVESGPATASSAALAPQAASVIGRIEVPPSLEQSCRKMCNRSVELGCSHASKCMPNCLAMGSQTPCTQEIMGFFQCLVDQPLKNWECGPDGVAAIRDKICDDEQRVTVACMQEKMK